MLNFKAISVSDLSPKLKAAIFTIVCGVLFASSGLAADALTYTKSYSVTGDYVVGGVGLRGATAINGFTSGTIIISGVPAGADIVAAFLYWGTEESAPK